MSSMSVLSAKELDSLLAILAESGPLEAVTTLFGKTFGKQQHFKATSAASILLGDSVSTCLLSIYQRLAGFFLLWDLYRSEPLKANPFLKCFLTALDDAQHRCLTHARLGHQVCQLNAHANCTAQTLPSPSQSIPLMHAREL